MNESEKESWLEEVYRTTWDSPRDPRSDEYKAGRRAALAFRIRGEHIEVPYRTGTVQADAFFCRNRRRTFAFPGSQG